VIWRALEALIDPGVEGRRKIHILPSEVVPPVLLFFTPLSAPRLLKPFFCKSFFGATGGADLCLDKSMCHLVRFARLFFEKGRWRSYDSLGLCIMENY
jgi:hypothetical protein